MSADSVSRALAGMMPRDLGSFVFSHGAGAGVVGGVRESYMGNARAMYEWCVRQGERALWLHASPQLEQAAGNAARFRSLRGVMGAMRASVSMGDSNNGAPWPLLSDRTWVVQGWHGTPLKAIGRAWPGHPLRDLTILERPDFFVSAGPEYTRRYLMCYDVDPDNFWETGNPRNDDLVRADVSDKQRRADLLRPLLGESARLFDYVVLYAPTWRDWAHGDLMPSPDRDLRELNKRMEQTNGLLVLRLHHREAQVALDAAQGLPRVVVADSLPLSWDVNDWCLVSDMLVTDYSSVFYDYLVLDRPIVHLVPDLEEYGNRRGFLVDPRDDFAGPAISTQEELVSEIKKGIESPQAHAALRDRLNHLHNPHEDGRSSDRVGERLLHLKAAERRGRG